MKPCPVCGGAAQRVIYLGFPMLLCANGECSCLWGLWSFMAKIETGEGGWAFLVYEGPYLRALWAWLKGAP